MRLDQLVFGEKFSSDKVFLEEKLFQRLDMEKELNYFKEQEKLKNLQSKEEVKKINIDDFSKVSMVIGEIIECKNILMLINYLFHKLKLVTKLNKLYRIAQFYSPNDLIGKKVVVVQNLETSMIRGVESNGMILCASSANKLEVLEVKEIPSGAIVR